MQDCPLTLKRKRLELVEVALRFRGLRHLGRNGRAVKDRQRQIDTILIGLVHPSFSVVKTDDRDMAQILAQI